MIRAKKRLITAILGIIALFSFSTMPDVQAVERKVHGGINQT